MRIMNVLYVLFRKWESLKLKVSMNYYRQLFMTECASCGKNTRIIRPISVKGLPHFIIGDNFKLDYYGIFEAWDYHNGISFHPSVTIGNNVSFGKYCHLGCINEITLGNNVLLGSGVLIIDHAHGKTDHECLSTPPNERRLFSAGPIRIGSNVWIGEKVSILPNVTIGNNVIIGANSVVTHDIPKNCVACGNPARIIKMIEMIE